MTYSEKIGKNISKIRKAKKLSQDDLATLAGVSKRQIIRIEAGENQSVKTIEKIANALLVTFKDLINDSG